MNFEKGLRAWHLLFFTSISIRVKVTLGRVEGSDSGLWLSGFGLKN